MPRSVFISYKRNVQPDESLALATLSRLQQSGYSVFMDQSIQVGLKWAEEIEIRLRNCDAFVLFLTASSARSEMVQSEIEMARRFKKTILPVRVAFAGKLPHPVNAYLDPIEYAFWRGPSDTQQLIATLKKAIDGIDTLPKPEFEPDIPISPAPAPGGALDLDDPHYISRPFDDQALRLAASGGQTVVLKGPRQMGKTSLLFRMIDSANKAKKSVAFVDCQLFEAACMETPYVFYERFARDIAEALDISERPSPQTPHDLTRWMEQEVLKKFPGGVTLAIDESERLLWAKFREDFFGMLRSWHNLRAHPIRRDWRKLDLFLVTSTEPALLIQGAQSPFNVGTIIELCPFGLKGLQRLNKTHGEPLVDSELDRLMELLAGHPFLTRKAFYEISPPQLHITPDQIFATASDDNGPFRDHLRRFLFVLLEMKDVREAFRDVLLGRGCTDHKLAYRLQAAGLVTGAESAIRPACRIYRDYFANRLN